MSEAQVCARLALEHVSHCILPLKVARCGKQRRTLSSRIKTLSTELAMVGLHSAYGNALNGRSIESDGDCSISMD